MMNLVEGLVLSVESRKAAIALRSHSGPQPPAPSPRSLPLRGMTLIELLAVIVIITTIVAAAIPLLSPSNDDRRIREAARTLNTFFTGAQARAISLHRPVGVALKRLGADTIKTSPKTGDANGMCLEVYYVEQQPPYAGLDVNSRACVAIHPQIPGLVIVRFVTRGQQANDGMPVGWDADVFPTGTIRPGDVIEINGSQFMLLPLLTPPANVQITDLDQDPTKEELYFGPPNNGVVQILAQPVNDSGQQINPKYDDLGREIGAVVQAQAPYWSSPASYRILRRPTAMSDEPYQLPEGTAIDLRASGVGINDYFYVQGMNDNTEGVLIMFAPEGRVSRVAYYQTPGNSIPFDQPVNDNIYLLVGRGDRLPPQATSSADPTLNAAAVAAANTDEKRAKLREPLNWLNGSSRWIVIGSQSGRIATVENGFVDLTATTTPPTPADESMRNKQIISAREHTQEVGQLGGR